MGVFSVDMDLETFIDELLNQYVEKKEMEKFNAKMNKAMEKGIVYGVPNQSFAAIVYSVSLDKVMAHPKGFGILSEDHYGKSPAEIKKWEYHLEYEHSRKHFEGSWAERRAVYETGC